jgi:phage virion morphogenesis protein
MSGVVYTVEIDAATLGQAENVLARIDDAALAVLMESIKNLIGEQTKERISSEKASPEGEPWAAWGSGYAKTRTSGKSLLESEGHLLTSLQPFVSGREAVIGTNLVYGAMHQFGGTKEVFPHLWGDIPARPYLGLSIANRIEIEELVSDYIGGLLA